MSRIKKFLSIRGSKDQSISARSMVSSEEAPPAYTAVPSPQTLKGSPPSFTTASNPFVTASPAGDSPYAFLANFDTVFVIDDSASMRGHSWRETSEALKAITPICTTYDSDGIDIYFLNHRSQRTNSGLAEGGYHNVNSATAVHEIFSMVQPRGGTPTGSRLNQILKPYVAMIEANHKARRQESHPVKPLNIIVITDGVPTDDVESVIVRAAKKLDAVDAESHQVGIQFFQVGNEYDAAENLQELDDALANTYGVRDMVDTVPFSGGQGSDALSSEGILKVVLGSVNRRLDRRRASDPRLRK